MANKLIHGRHQVLYGCPNCNTLNQELGAADKEITELKAQLAAETKRDNEAEITEDQLTAKPEIEEKPHCPDCADKDRQIETLKTAKDNVVEHTRQWVNRIHELFKSHGYTDLDLFNDLEGLIEGVLVQNKDLQAKLTRYEYDENQMKKEPKSLAKQIEAYHPTVSGIFDGTYEKALELVGERHEKYELVDLVNYFMVKLTAETKRANVAEKAIELVDCRTSCYMPCPYYDSKDNICKGNCASTFTNLAEQQLAKETENVK